MRSSAEAPELSLVAIVAIPPPISGQSEAARALVDTLQERGIDVHVIDLADRLDDHGAAAAVRRSVTVSAMPVRLCRAARPSRPRQAVYLQLGWGASAMLRDLPLLVVARRLGL